MKLRILDNSIRLRLTQSEVGQLGQSGAVEARTSFPDGRDFTYAVECSPACVRPEAYFTGSVVRVRLPESTVLPWLSSEQVSIEGEQTLDDGGTLRILVEKDFACLAPRADEDESDMFPHPQSQSDRC